MVSLIFCRVEEKPDVRNPICFHGVIEIIALGFLRVTWMLLKLVLLVTSLPSRSPLSKVSAIVSWL